MHTCRFCAQKAHFWVRLEVIEVKVLAAAVLVLLLVLVVVIVAVVEAYATKLENNTLFASFPSIINTNKQKPHYVLFISEFSFL